MKALALVLFFFPITVLYAQVDDARSRAILQETARLLESYEDVFIRFTFNMVNKVHDIDESQKGKAWMKGKMYKIDMGQQVMISDGKTAWTYMPEMKEVHIGHVEEGDESNPLEILKNWEENYRSKYIRTESVAGREIYIIDLIPKEGRSFFRVRVRINKANNQLVSSTIYDKDSTTFTYIIEAFETNTGLKSSDFTFDPGKHPDVEVVDLR